MPAAATPTEESRPEVTPITRSALVWPTVIFALFVALYAVLGSLQEIPLISPDEKTYGHLARSLADGDGFAWRGAPVPWRAALYIYAITPAWLGASTVTAYSLTKIIGALMVSSVVFPTWLLARRLVAPAVALVVAVLTLAGTWMTTAGFVLTENLAFPLSTWCLCAMTIRLRQPRSRWGWAAIVFAGLASWARLQLVVLFAVLLVALVLDVVRAGEERSERARAQRPLLIVLAVLVALLGVLALTDLSGAAGTYGGLAHFSPSLSKVLAATGNSWLGLFSMAGFVPIVVVVSLATSRRAWTDATAGPLLAVIVPATVLIVALSGWASAGFGTPWHVQRYVEYVLPPTLLLLAVVARRPALLPRYALGIAIALAAAALLGNRADPAEEKAYYAVATGGRELLGVSAGTSVALAALLAGLGGTALLLRARSTRSRPRQIAIGGLLVTLAVVALQSQSAWRVQIDRARDTRAAYPSDLQEIDHAARGPVARLAVSRSDPRFSTLEFFNRDIDQSFVPDAGGLGLQGPRCLWNVAAGGRIALHPGCGGQPARFYLDDPTAIMTFAGQTDVKRLHGYARVVSVPAAPRPLRVRSIIVMPCDDRTLLSASGHAVGTSPRVCRAAISVLLWLDAPATLELRIAGGSNAHTAQVAGRAYRIAPRVITTLRTPAPAGQSRISAGFDTQELPVGLPDLVSARLVQPGRAEPIS